MRLTYLLRGRSMLEEVSAGVSHRGWGAMKAYLVTGGAGFIGSHIVDRLVELGAVSYTHLTLPTILLV